MAPPHGEGLEGQAYGAQGQGGKQERLNDLPLVGEIGE